MHPLASPIYIRTTGTNVTHPLLYGPLCLLWLTFFYLDNLDPWDSPDSHISIRNPVILVNYSYLYIFISGTLVAHVTQLFLFWLIWLTYFYPDSCDSCDSPISIRTPVTLVTHLFLSGPLWLMWLTYFYSDSCDSCDGGADTLYNGEHVTFFV